LSFQNSTATIFNQPGKALDPMKMKAGIKTSSLFILLLISSLVSGQGTWERINVPATQYLKSVFFTDSLYGWVVGDSGIILHTTNSGVTWVQQDTHATNDVEDVFFLNRNLGWASTFNYTTLPYRTILLNTTDGGNTWIAQPYPKDNIFITCILYRDSLNGWMGGKPHALVRTNDGGATWRQAAIDTSILAFFPVLNIQFYNEQYGYASGGMFDIAGVTWHTSNGGELWYAIDAVNAPADEVHGLHIFDSLHVLGAGGDPDFGYGVGMIRTADGGLNWNYEELDIQGNAYDLDFRNENEAWAPLGPRRKLIYSLDAGATWTPIYTPDSVAIYDMIFPDSLHGFAVGKEGAMLKYHPPVIPGVQPVVPFQTEYSLSQNNPNPANTRTTIMFTVPQRGVHQTIQTGQAAAPLQLKIYTVFGKEVASLINETLPPGDHAITFDASTLPGGIYFYVLQTFAAGQTKVVAGPKKMIVLR
jgi:photosystem II stability/assembly factor-like uncharacterized protein